MASFESPLGARRFGGVSPSGMKEFVVDEPGSPNSVPQINYDELNNFTNRLNNFDNEYVQQDLSEEERAAVENIRKIKSQRAQGRERLDEGARHRIEILLGMTRMKVEVEFGDEKFGLQTLRSKELHEVMKSVLKCTTKVEELFEMRRQILARSLYSIAGADTSLFIGSDSLEDKLYFIDMQDHNFLSKLYLEYTKLNKDAELKYGIKNEKDALEVAENIKK